MPPARSANLLLTFDAFGTLFTPKIPIAAQYALVAREHGLINLRETDLQRAFKQAFKAESKQNPNYGKAHGMDPEKWWANVVTNTFAIVTSTSLPSSLVPTLIRRFASNTGYALYPEVISLLRTLRSPPPSWPYISTTVGIITNSDPRVISVLDSLGVGVRSYSPSTPNQRKNKEEGAGDKALLDFVTFSYDIGFEKPDSEIFNIAKSIGRQCANGITEGTWRCVHVGDDLVKDYQGAESAGWKGILVDRKAEKTKGGSKDFVQRLDEVLGVLLDLEKSHSS